MRRTATFLLLVGVLGITAFIVLAPLAAKRNTQLRRVCESRLAIAQSSTDTLTALLSKPERGLWAEDCQWWLARLAPAEKTP